MMNGFEININEAGFKAKSPQEQNWILFQGIMAVNKTISHIDQFGCEYSKHKYSFWTLKVITAICAGITIGLGVIYTVYSLVTK